MKFKVRFTHHANVRVSPIFSEYRPCWTAYLKPEQNCARLLFDDIQMIKPGETHDCILEPMVAGFWLAVGQDDVLKCMEGSREVGEAIVLEVIRDVPVV